MRSLVLFTILIAVPVTVFAATWNEYHDALDRQDYRTAVTILEAKANDGNASAQDALGVFYLTDTTAKESGIQQSFPEAMKWFRKAAEQGNADAQLNIGTLYLKGWGVEESHEEAAKWYQKAADNDLQKAQLKLAHMYADGDGVKQDYKEAYKWLTIAGGGTTSTLGGNSVNEKLTVGEIAEAKTSAAKWMATHLKAPANRICDGVDKLSWSTDDLVGYRFALNGLTYTKELEFLADGTVHVSEGPTIESPKHHLYKWQIAGKALDIIFDGKRLDTLTKVAVAEDQKSVTICHLDGHMSRFRISRSTDRSATK